VHARFAIQGPHL